MNQELERLREYQEEIQQSAAYFEIFHHAWMISFFGGLLNRFINTAVSWILQALSVLVIGFYLVIEFNEMEFFREAGVSTDEFQESMIATRVLMFVLAFLLFFSGRLIRVVSLRNKIIAEFQVRASYASKALNRSVGSIDEIGTMWQTTVSDLQKEEQD